MYKSYLSIYICIYLIYPCICILCRGVAPDYAADLSVPILERDRNAKEREIGSSTILD